MTRFLVHQLPPRLDPSQCAPLAAIHTACFPEGWSAQAIADLIQSDGVGCFLAVQEGADRPLQLGFILVRAVVGEAEVLTLAVSPQARRQGVGRVLLNEAAAFAISRKADKVFLEVAKENTPAIGLYQGTGFVIVGQRPAYYEGPNGTRDAWIMQLPLTAAPEPEQRG